MESLRTFPPCSRQSLVGGKMTSENGEILQLQQQGNYTVDLFKDSSQKSFFREVTQLSKLTRLIQKDINVCSIVLHFSRQLLDHFFQLLYQSIIYKRLKFLSPITPIDSIHILTQRFYGKYLKIKPTYHDFYNYLSLQQIRRAKQQERLSRPF